MNLNSLDLNLVRVFDALMQERSVTRAGEKIGLSQPAVSAALNRLRHALGDQLFIRRGNEMIATPRAEELGELARSALTHVERMLQAGRSIDLSRLERTFTLMGADFFSTLFMPALARRVAVQAPGVRLRLLDSARGDVARLLADDAIDMALERPLDVPDWVSSVTLFHSPFVLIAAADNSALAALEEGQTMPLEVFCALPHALRSIDGTMSGMVDQALAATGRRRQVMLALPHFHAVALAVAASDHIAAIPVQFARAVREMMGLRIFETPFPVPPPEIKLYWHARHDGDAAHQWLRHVVVATCQELGLDEAVEVVPR
jgi:DNA-binding transcriptional LysR family regulator